MSRLFATSRSVEAELRGALAVDVDAQRRVVEHLRDAHVLGARDRAQLARAGGARRANAASRSRPSTCTSIGADSRS